MRFLTNELIYSLTDAVSMIGGYAPDGVMACAEETMTIKESEICWAFLGWVDANELKFGVGNIHEIFDRFMEEGATDHIKATLDEPEKPLDVSKITLIETKAFTPTAFTAGKHSLRMNDREGRSLWNKLVESSTHCFATHNDNKRESLERYEISCEGEVRMLIMQSNYRAINLVLSDHWVTLDTQSLQYEVKNRSGS
ncbi:hypothetical protein LRP52_40450 [Photobacterium sp. ZSDE20]|uniref:Uncharacterized protein n=1 Tax=Photobacterium pectinilyticum TaxID=2906793 RepID=A0ABT1N7N9_9GAMM|nr:hypothetical protein [Photobacterium sp. ZSDE20]MCQ1060765.1 hypothetical protein [Photobacterium sp. ZSDE20]MDD1828454.1 hypothetical protein [Photobacterium sp. ZSDE20]